MTLKMSRVEGARYTYNVERDSIWAARIIIYHTDTLRVTAGGLSVAELDAILQHTSLLPKWEIEVEVP